MDTAFIIQARLGSSRLPNKILLPFYNGKSILELLIEKLVATDKEIPIIVATTTNKENDKIIELCKNYNSISFYRGSEENVLERFIKASEAFNIKNIIRICSDNPFLDKESLILLINMSKDSRFDYISFKVKNLPSIKTHFGFWAEFVTYEALLKVRKLSENKKYLEHVTNYIYEHSNEFDIKFISVTSALSNREDIRLTLDTIDDFEILKEVYLSLKSLYNEFGINEIIKFLDSHNHFLHKMKLVIQRNTK